MSPARHAELAAPPVWAVGLMTGTVLDGNIDVALLRTDGVRVETFGRYALAPYDEATRTLLERTLAAARAWDFVGEEPPIFARAEAALTRAQAAAVDAVVDEAALDRTAIGVVGFHGQSVLHRAPDPARERAGRTRQLGDGALMARLLGVPVAFDFRSADVAAGGQGAPLAPAYHVALLRALGAGPDTAVLNLGGVANLTWWDGAERVIAFDTGPANAPLNDFVRSRGRGEMDRDGAIAAAGRVDEARLAALLAHPWFDAPWPKSLDRFDFPAGLAAGATDEDGAALLCAFAASAVGRALDALPHRPSRLIVCGGGRRNPALLDALERRADVVAVRAEAVGWRGDAIEAEAFAYLAVRTLRGLAISFPTTTGAPAPMCGGRLAHPDGRVTSPSG